MGGNFVFYGSSSTLFYFFFLLLFPSSERTRADPPRFFHCFAVDKDGIELRNTQHITALNMTSLSHTHNRRAHSCICTSHRWTVHGDESLSDIIAFADSARLKSWLANTNVLQVTGITTHTRTHAARTSYAGPTRHIHFLFGGMGT